MRRSLPALLLPALFATLAPARADAGELRRFAVVVGANQGAPDRVRLRYAVQDAERFARLITQMGGVSEVDCLTLREPGRQPLLDALGVVRERSLAAHQSGQRTEVLFYFSGHADESGLMLGRERLGYRELREALAGMPTDVGIAVLDACASGAITRLKGGRLQPAFLTDESVQVHGHAYLTSSSESESAQESDQLQGSFFTHALLTGLRGAADASGDGKVTFGEAYQFAFDETLTKTAATQGGAQHPAYDIRMAGTGDVVLTDVRETSASLVLGPELDGRLYVWDASHRLLAELSKPAGRSVELGLEPGEYELRYEQQGSLLKTRVVIAKGERRAVTRVEMTPLRRQPTRLRGAGSGTAEDPYSLASRARVELQLGGSDLSVHTEAGGDTSDVAGGAVGLGFGYWLHDTFALEVSFGGSNLQTSTRKETDGTTVKTQGLFQVLAGVRFYPPLPGIIRPHVGLAAGPVSQYEVVVVDAKEGQNNSTEASRTDTRAGLQLRGGVDILLGRGFVVGVQGGVLWRKDRGNQYVGMLGLGWRIGARRAE
jgi:hypothetical protein